MLESAAIILGIFLGACALFVAIATKSVPALTSDGDLVLDTQLSHQDGHREPVVVTVGRWGVRIVASLLWALYRGSALVSDRGCGVRAPVGSLWCLGGLADCWPRDNRRQRAGVAADRGGPGSREEAPHGSQDECKLCRQVPVGSSVIFTRFSALVFDHNMLCAGVVSTRLGIPPHHYRLWFHPEAPATVLVPV